MGWRGGRRRWIAGSEGIGMNLLKRNCFALNLFEFSRCSVASLCLIVVLAALIKEQQDLRLAKRKGSTIVDHEPTTSLHNSPRNAILGLVRATCQSQNTSRSSRGGLDPLLLPSNSSSSSSPSPSQLTLIDSKMDAEPQSSIKVRL